jgi:fused signal recognition particle receptor
VTAPDTAGSYRDRAEGTAPGRDAASPDRSEHQADEREREADEREERLEEHGARLRQHAVEVRAQVESVCERAAQAVEEAQTVLEASEDRVLRAEAALDRAYADAARKRASAARPVKQGEQHPAPQQRDLTDLAGRISALRERTAAAAARLAETEEQVVRVHDELAARDPGNPEYKWLADDARGAARRARETERKYSSS